MEEMNTHQQHNNASMLQIEQHGGYKPIVKKQSILNGDSRSKLNELLNNNNNNNNNEYQIKSSQYKHHEYYSEQINSPNSLTNEIIKIIN